MKILSTIAGAGYPLQMDFLLNLQTEMLALGNSLFSAIPYDMVLSGCAVTDNGNGTVNIAAGMMYVGGQVIRFDGANNVPSAGTKAIGQAVPVNTDMMQFGNGSNYNTYSEVKAVVVNATGTNVQEIKVKTTLYNITQYIQDTVLAAEVKGTIKEIYDLDGTFIGNFDTTGLGVTPRWDGWALDNGSNGTRGSDGMAIIAAGTYTDPATGEHIVYADGDRVGKANQKMLSSEMPQHTHFGFVNGVATENPGTNLANATMGVAVSGNLYGNQLAYEMHALAGTPSVGLTSSSGGGQAQNNMQPSIAAYRVVKIR